MLSCMKNNAALHRVRQIVLLKMRILSTSIVVSAAEVDITQPKGPAAKGTDPAVVGEETAVLTQVT
jgi:hypothetical protein